MSNEMRESLDGKLRILVAGAGSYIGTSFAAWLGQWPERYRVDAIDTIGEAWRSHSFLGYDAVFHVAGIAHVTADPAKTDLYRKVNTDLAIAVAIKAKTDGVGQFVFMSSALVYGADDPVGVWRPITSDTKPAPSDVYGNSKWMAERGLADIAEDNFTISVLRAPSVYGPNSKGNFPRLMKLAQWCPVFPSVGTRRSMLYIDHLCEFVRIVIEHRTGGVFFPQDADTVDTAEVVREYRRQAGQRTLIIRGFRPLLRLLGRRGGLINKVFGNKFYDPAISSAPGGEEYRSVDFPEAMRRCRAAQGLPDKSGGEMA